MNLYLLVDKNIVENDSYDSIVVSAENEQEALSLHPNRDFVLSESLKHPKSISSGSCVAEDSEWKIDNVQIILIGKSYINDPKIIIASFNKA